VTARASQSSTRETYGRSCDSLRKRKRLSQQFPNTTALPPSRHDWNSSKAVAVVVAKLSTWPRAHFFARQNEVSTKLTSLSDVASCIDRVQICTYRRRIHQLCQSLKGVRTGGAQDPHSNFQKIPSRKVFRTHVLFSLSLSTRFLHFCTSLDAINNLR